MANDIDVLEVRKNVVGWKLIRLEFRVLDRIAKVTYSKVDDEDLLIEYKSVEFQGSEFNALVADINSGDNIKTTVTQAVRSKLGI